MGCSSSTAVHEPVTKENPMVKASADADIHSFAKSYTLGRQLGTGKYADVYEVTHKKSHMKYAVKCIPKSKLVDDEDVEALAQEIKIMQRMNHPNLVKLESFFIENNTYYLVQELMTGGELFDFIVDQDSYSEAKAKVFVRTLADAMAYCHSHGVVHRDLKPENILLSTNRSDAVLKIADFGFAKDTNESGGSLATACGTPGYVAPEILEGKAYGAPVDCWSLGVIFYILLCGYPPFAADTQTQLFSMIKRADFAYDPEDWAGVSKDARDFINRILVVDPAKRLTCKQMLKHKWLASSSANTADLTTTKVHMKSFNARRKLKASMHTVRTAVRMKLLLAGVKRAAAQAGQDESKTDDSRV